MTDPSKENKELLEENTFLNQRIQELEQAESERQQIKYVYSFPILFMIVVLLFIGGLASGACNAASNSLKVRVGSELDFPPYAFADESGQPAGFSIELIEAVTDTMGLSIKISTGAWDTVWNALVAGQLDVLPIVAKLPERLRLIDFSLPHTETYDAFFVRKGDSPIPNIAAARGKAIVVMRSDAAHHELLVRNFQGNLIIVDTIPEGLKLISSGKHNAFLCSKLIGALSIKEHRLTGLTAGPIIPDYKRVFSFGVKKGDTELLEKLNQGLLIVKTNGEYDRIYDKWLTFDDPWRKARKYLLPAFAIAIAIALIAGFWLVTLQRLVRKRARELAEKNEVIRLAYDDLEARVAERTAELAQSNQALQAEITERKRSEEALRQSEERYQALFERSLDCVYIHDFAGNFLDANNAALNLLGYRREEIASLNFATLLSEDQIPVALQALQEIMDTGYQTNSTEFRLKRKNGDDVFVETIGSVILHEGIPSAIQAIGRDITERKKAEAERKVLEERLQRSEKMEALGTLAAGVAHDLNNVLGIVVGYSELLLNEADMSSSIRSNIMNIMSGGLRAAAIVEDMLTLARRGVPGRQVLNLNDMIVDLCKSPEFEKLSSSHPAVRIKTDIEPDLLNISGSSVQLGKALFNLASNASEAMPKGGNLTIKTENQYVDKPIAGYDQIREGDYVVLSVSDTGEGIPAADLKRNELDRK